MRKLLCPVCREAVFFEQLQCPHCDTQLAFDVENRRLCILERDSACANRQLIGCNWLGRGNRYCVSCCLTRTIPNLASTRNILLWRRVEQAKRRLIYDLYRLALPSKNQERQIAFDILSEETAGHPIMTGHVNGLITFGLSEADDVEREARRIAFREPYRTLLGHFRHEVGHFYWDLLVDQTNLKIPFRLIFGDETQSYDDLLKSYHARADRSYDRTSFISEYATAHPWEDWAETFAHFLHIVSTLDSASMLPSSSGERLLQLSEDPYQETDFSALLASWRSVAYIMNELNRSMGLSDAYPFDLSQAVRGKLHFVHMAILNFRDRTRQKVPTPANDGAQKLRAAADANC